MKINELFDYRKLQIRMLQFKKHQYLLDPNHITQIVAKTKPTCLTSQAHRTDQDRLLYSRLIEYSTNYLHQITQQLPTGLSAPIYTLQDLSKQFFSPLFEEVISLAKRQCNQKAQLLRMLYNFYEDGIATAEKVCQQRIKSLTAEYYLSWSQKEEALKRQQSCLRDKIKEFEEENQKKWKTFYLVVRDNRVLRRQKGKLMRAIQEERAKIANIHQEMINIARENQKNKLLANYQQEKQSFQLFLKNSVSINKLERFMKDYPKISKRLLKIDLHQLQVAEQNLLNQKIEYILKTASEFEEIYDEYEDLIDIAKPNKILFNACTQTYCEDTPQSQHLIALKAVLRNKLVQTCPQPMKLSSELVSVCIGKKEPEKCRRRRGAHIEKNEATKIQTIKNEIINTSNDMQIRNRQVFVKIVGIKRLKSFSIESKTVDMLVSASSLQDESPPEPNEYPNLPTKFKLNKDISRSSQRSSRFSGITNLTSSLASHSQTLIKAVESSNFKISQRKESKNSGKAEPLTRSSFKTLSSKNNINPTKSKLSRLNTENLQLTEHFEGFGEWNEVIDEQEEGKLACFQEKVQAETKQQKEVVEKQRSQLGSKRQSKTTNLNEQPLINLVVPRTSQKKLRKSGFATNKPGAKYLEISSDLTNRQTVRIGNQSNAPRKSQLSISVDPFLLEDTENKMVAVSKDKNPRQAAQIKTINIFSQEYSRLADRLLKAIYSQRKQLSEGKTTFQHFLRSFMINQYGSHLQFTLSTKITSSRSDHSPLAEAFDILLNGYESPAYLQTCFGIFAKTLSANGSWLLQIDSEKADLIYSQLTKSLLGEEQSEGVSQSDPVNLCTLFVRIQQSFRRKLRQSELFHFLQIILPRSQQILSFEQIRQLFSIFIGEDHYLKRLLALKQFCKSDISPLSLCIFAFREKWDSMVNVQSFIANKFLTIFGEANNQWADLIFERCSRSQKIRWAFNLIKNSLMRMDSASEQSLKTKYLSLLFVTYQVEKLLPISQPLLDISQQWEILMTRVNLSLNPT